jgi:hypothetical protein
VEAPGLASGRATTSGFEYGHEGVEVAVAAGREGRVDHFLLMREVGVGGRVGAAYRVTGAAGELAHGAGRRVVGAGEYETAEYETLSADPRAIASVRFDRCGLPPA